jgi:type I restriction enzyme, S subunit
MIRRFRFDLTSIEQGWSPQCDNSLAEPHEWGVLKVGCVNGTEFDESEHKRLPDDLESRTTYEIKPGDVLMSRANTTELLGSAALVRDVRPRLLLCDKLYRMPIDARSLDSEFVVYAFGSHATRYQFERDATGASASMKNIGQDTIKGLLMPRPPLTQQRDIVRVLNTKRERVNQVVAKVRESIDRLREYRTALISAAVTGKIDVRQDVA